jgi:hypothetical protein
VVSLMAFLSLPKPFFIKLNSAIGIVRSGV